MPRRTGWTLFELLAVMALLALVTAGAAFTLRSPLRGGRERSQIEAALVADRTARSYARRFHQTAELEFDAEADPPTMRVSYQHKAQRAASTRPIEPLREVRVLGQGQTGRQRRIALDVAGRGPTYALRFALPDGERTWIVMAGESGQPIFDQTEGEVEELAKLLAAPATSP